MSAALAVGIAALALAPSAGAVPPANDSFAAGQELVGEDVAVAGSNVEATAEAGEPAHAGQPAEASVWYRWTAPASRSATIETCGSALDTRIAVYTGVAVSALSHVASNEDACGFQSRVRFDATAGTTYHVAVDGYFGETGTFTLSLELATPPGNDAFANAAPLTGFEDSARGSNVDASAEAGEPNHGSGGGHSVWYRWRAPAGGIVVIDACRSRFDTVLAVYSGTRLAGLQRVEANDDACGRQSRLTFRARKGTEYRIAVDGSGDDTGAVVIELAQVRPGRYTGRTEIPDRKRIGFTIPGNGERVERFTFDAKLDCTQRGFPVGELTIRGFRLRGGMRIQETATGGKFSDRDRFRFRGGGNLTIEVHGTLRPPERASGNLDVRARFPGGVRCKNFFGAVRWNATHA